MLAGAVCGLIACTAPPGIVTMVVAPVAAVSVTLTARACGFDTTTANGDVCASRMQTFIALQVKPDGHVLPGGSHSPATAELFELPHTWRLTFLMPGMPVQLSPPWTSTTSIALS